LSEEWIWDRYWHFDRIASCFDGAGRGNYEESVLAGWRDFFRGLPAGCLILDLCTGNGAIAQVAAATGRAEGKGFGITAVDRADIDPPAHVSRWSEDLAAIRFVPRTSAEALPFPDRSFGAVTSQYGLEYCDLPRAVAELARVAAPGARVRLVVHAAEGAVAAGAKRVIADADLLLDGIGLPDKALACFEAVARAEREAAAADGDRRRAERCFAEFQAALERTARHIPAAADPQMFRNSGAVLFDSYRRRASFHLDQLLAKAEAVRSEILAHRGRLQALVDAALDQAAAEALAERLRRAGAEAVTAGPLVTADGLIGHELSATFPR
jgi:SAM-dependent methyltransferase